MGQYTIPTVVERTALGERAFDIYSRLLSERIVFLGTEIDDGVANVVMAQLLHLESASSDQEISLYINSPGGTFSALTAIYDTMQFIRPDVATICIGQASSAAAVLLAAGAPGRRAVLRHAKVLLHQPSTQAQGTLPDLAVQAKEVARVRADVEEILSRHTGHPVEKIRRDTDRNKTFTAQEAVDYGLADEVIVSREAVPAAWRPAPGDQAARPTMSPGPRCARAARRSRTASSGTTLRRRARSSTRSRPTQTSRSDTSMCRASQIAARTSEDASLRPRSISERYGIETSRGPGHVGEGPALPLPGAAQHLTHLGPQQGPGPLLALSQDRSCADRPSPLPPGCADDPPSGPG